MERYIGRGILFFCIFPMIFLLGMERLYPGSMSEIKTLINSGRAADIAIFILTLITQVVFGFYLFSSRDMVKTTMFVVGVGLIVTTFITMVNVLG